MLSPTWTSHREWSNIHDDSRGHDIKRSLWLRTFSNCRARTGEARLLTEGQDAAVQLLVNVQYNQCIQNALRTPSESRILIRWPSLPQSSGLLSLISSRFQVLHKLALPQHFCIGECVRADKPSNILQQLGLRLR